MVKTKQPKRVSVRALIAIAIVASFLALALGSAWISVQPMLVYNRNAVLVDIFVEYYRSFGEQPTSELHFREWFRKHEDGWPMYLLDRNEFNWGTSLNIPVVGEQELILQEPILRIEGSELAAKGFNELITQELAFLDVDL